MKLRRQVQLLRGPIDLAPLINVVLLLLIFFILSSSFVLQSGVKITLPSSLDGTHGVTNVRHIVAITAADPPLIFFNDQISSREKLSEQFKQVAAAGSGNNIVIKADRYVAYGTVVDVMNQALAAGLSVVVATQGQVAEPPAGNQK